MTCAMLRSIPFALITCAAIAPATGATVPQPEQRHERTCAEQMREQERQSERAAWQRRPTDLDGRGVCALKDGGIAYASRGNGGGLPGGSAGGSQDEGLVHRFGDGAASHRLRASAGVTVVDMPENTQRIGGGGWGHRYGEDLFSQQVPFEPITGPLGNATPGYGTTTVYGLEAGQFALRSVAAGIEGAANPGLSGGPLTSRSGGRMGADDAGTAPAPVPEPGTWAMLLGGLALLAVVARRQRR